MRTRRRGARAPLAELFEALADTALGNTAEARVHVRRALACRADLRAAATDRLAALL